MKKRDFMRFFSYLEKDLKASNNRRASFKGVLSSLSAFVETILDDEYPDFHNLMGSFTMMSRTPVREKTVLSDDRVEWLLGELVRNKKYNIACYLALLLSSGMRRSEALQMKVEDFTGSGEIPLFGQDYIDYAKYGKIGMYLLISGKMEPRKYNAEIVDLRIKYIKLLQDERDKLIQKISITIPIHELDETTVAVLTSKIKEHPGNCLLYFRVIDGENNISLNLFSPDTRLTVTKDFVDYLNENENIDFKING